ncbi:glucosamine-phosphate N-acetyltransferase-like protein [Zygosaccharomyces mellis]|uniref:Glucosamine 6-phosphate N-acetyltransferase n=1 Tax=Zygosaccharomyces mellis TaxID=42258 RepID=A0A4C2EBC0_9SACH|nr:glucosamine-phosphate N-acetyltransferase-like protein [Zygosaccharomyces mellis]
MGTGYSIRRVERQDYEGVLQALSALTTVGSVSRTQFEETVDHWNHVKVSSEPEILQYHPYVVLHGEEVAATGMLFIERKLIHGCGLVGHIEDIAVSLHHQGKQLGRALIDHLTNLGLRHCYKVILDCDERNVRFYEKCGYSRAGVEMQRR